ncbi:MAG: HDIG domain-containing protein [bacterium]|nr:HDIG domain-containing protein [bacterium]
MTREEALALVKSRLTNKNLFKHTLAVEAVMRRLARHFGEDEDFWGLAGLLHDIDYDETRDDPDRHSQVGADLLAAQGLPTELVDAVRAHNERHGLSRATRMARALYTADPLTGLIVAAALISPSRRLTGIDAGFVLNRFGERAFARGANREVIRACETELGIGLEEFVALGLEAMQAIAGEIGL